MRRLWISLAVLGLTAAASLYSGSHLSRLSSHMGVLLEQAEQAAIAGDWSRTAQLTDDAYKTWEQQTVFLYSTLRHTDTDSVYLHLRQAQCFAKEEDEHGYLTANSALQSKLWLMEEAEGLSIENVL